MKFIHIILIVLTFIILSCDSDRPPKQTAEKGSPPKGITKPIEINKINFYFENSASMKGYLNGDNFQQTVRRILNNSQSDSLNSFFVNTKEYFQSNIKDRIAKKDIKTAGTGNSDHQFIFTNAIKNAVENDLSIVITDGIYSMKDGNIAIVEVDIEAAFKKALKANEIETVVLKMSSKYIGTYYTESNDCSNVQINQERPYYILLFGSKKVIDKALEDIVNVEKLNGYQNSARFFLTKEMKVDYSVLLNGDDKKGSFKPMKRGRDIIKTFVLEEKYEPRNSKPNDAYLQFAIAVDFSEMSIPESYLINTKNYTTSSNTNYEIVEIKDLSNIDDATRNDIKVRNKKATHLIVLKGKTKLFGDLIIQLDINTPSWINETGSADDCNIMNDAKTTFSFDRLMSGISKAYEEINNKKEYINITITINS